MPASILRHRAAIALATLAALASLSPLLGEPVRIWVSSAADVRYYNDMLSLYREQLDPDFEAELSYFGFRELPDKLAVAIKTGINEPDIVQIDEAFFGMYLRDKPPFLDLTERVQASALQDGIPPARLSLFSSQGRIYGIAQSLSAAMLFYRRDLFADLEITPQDLGTWQDFERVGSYVAQQNKALLALDPSYFEILLRQRGGRLFGPEGEVLPDFELSVSVLEWLEKLVADRVAIVPDRSSIFDPVFFTSDVANNEVLAVIGADWYGLDMIQNYSHGLEVEWGVMPLPAWSEDQASSSRASSYAGQGLLIYAESERPDDAWRFIEFVLTDREANVRRFLAGNSFPSFRPVYDDPRLHQPMASFGGDSIGAIAMEIANDIPPVAMDSRRPQLVFMLREQLLPAVFSGQIEARAALEQLRSTLTSPPSGE